MTAPLLIALAAASLSFPPVSPQGDCTVPPELKGQPPAAEGPIPVDVRIFVVDIAALDEAKEAATLDCFVRAQWRDPRLSAESLGWSLESCRLGADDVWHPELFIINRRRIFPSTAEVRVDAEGNVVFRQRVYGEFSQALELARLPFDRQVLRMRVSSVFPPTQVELRPDPGSGIYEDAGLPGWIVEGYHAQVSNEFVPGPDVTISVIEGGLAVHRDLGFYLWRLFLPLVLITLMASAVFYIPPANLGPRMGVATASVFSLLAFLIGTRNFVPRISYLTIAEKLNVAAMAMVFLALGVAITGSNLAEQDKGELALRIQRVARWVYPLLGVALAVYILGQV